MVAAQVRTYFFDNNGNIWVFNAKADSTPTKIRELLQKTQGNLARIGPMRGSMGGGGSPYDLQRRGMMGRGPGSSMPGMPPTGFGLGMENSDLMPVNFKEFSKDPGKYECADMIVPKHMAIVVGSFPYKKQLQEFKEALRLTDPAQLFQEKVGDPDKEKPAFQFLGFDVQRRVVKPDGTAPDWETKGDPNVETLDLGENSPFAKLVFLLGKRFAHEDEKTARLRVPGLAMPLPQQASEDAYPPLEKDLSEYQKTAQKAEANNQMQVELPPDPRFDQSNINIFDPGQGDAVPSATATSGFPTRMGPSPMPSGSGPNDRRGMTTGPVPGVAPSQKQTEDYENYADFVLFRLIDITVQPGKTYEYRIRIKMVNPNYGKPDSQLSFHDLGLKKELTSEWVEVKAKVEDKALLRGTVPDDLHFYAVDEKALKPNPREYKGINSQKLPDAEQAVIQAHRWLDTLVQRAGSDTPPVGDWVIAERLFVYRGESLAKDAVVKVPIWVPAKRGFVFPPSKEGIKVAFGTDNINKVPLLVDFEGGPKQPVSYAPRVVQGPEGPKPTTTKMFEETVKAELLLFSPSGKLLVRKSQVDENDAEAQRAAREMVGTP